VLVEDEAEAVAMARKYLGYSAARPSGRGARRRGPARRRAGQSGRAYNGAQVIDGIAISAACSN